MRKKVNTERCLRENQKNIKKSSYVYLNYDGYTISQSASNNNNVIIQDEYLLVGVSYLKDLFRCDLMFTELIQTLNSNSTLLYGLESNDFTREIIWWLRRTNISCFDSYLLNEEHFVAFAHKILENPQNWI